MIAKNKNNKYLLVVWISEKRIKYANEFNSIIIFCCIVNIGAIWWTVPVSIIKSFLFFFNFNPFGLKKKKKCFFYNWQRKKCSPFDVHLFIWTIQNATFSKGIPFTVILVVVVFHFIASFFIASFFYCIIFYGFQINVSFSNQFSP